MKNIRQPRFKIKGGNSQYEDIDGWQSPAKENYRTAPYETLITS